MKKFFIKDCAALWKTGNPQDSSKTLTPIKWHSYFGRPSMAVWPNLTDDDSRLIRQAEQIL